MTENSRIEDLRRRVQKDPASIAFAQLAEECRRSGEHQEAVDTCRAGLAIHPGYLSARVTLGRALIDLNQLDEAQAELSTVLDSAPENLAAIRGLAEIHHRRGDLSAALAQYRAALLLARNDPDLEETIADLSRQVEPAKPAPAGGLTMQHMQDELLKRATAPPKAAMAPEVAPPPPKADNPAKAGSHDSGFAAEAGFHEPDRGVRLQADHSSAISADSALRQAHGVPSSSTVRPSSPSTLSLPNGSRDAVDVVPPPASTPGATDDRATRTVAALEQWLAAIHVSREQRNA